MSIFKDTFDKSGTSAQNVTSEPVTRILGGVIKVAALVNLGAAIIGGSAPVIAAVAVVAGVGYVVGAGAQARGIETTDTNGSAKTLNEKTVQQLNPLKF